MAATAEARSLVAAPHRARGAVSEAARGPEQQRWIGPVLSELDRLLAALAPDVVAAAELTPLREATPVSGSGAELEALRREVERLRALSQQERGLLAAVLTRSAHGI